MTSVPLAAMVAKIKGLRRAPRIVALTGAGISSESGIRTFRDQGGLWEEHEIEDVATPRGFRRNPALVHRFYNARRRQARECLPNLGHLALVELDQLLGDHFHLVTQNVDDLHEKAGAKRLWHMHGELFKVRCLNCGRVYPWWEDLDDSHACHGCQARMRPHIVWFDEVPFHLDEIMSHIIRCDIFVAIGTSGLVYPAAGFHEVASRAGAFTVEINLERTAGSFHGAIGGPASRSVPQFVEAIKGVVNSAAVWPAAAAPSDATFL